MNQRFIPYQNWWHRFVILISCISFSISHGQYVFNTYTTDDGLITNDISCTFRDSRGFVWIGTKEGLQVYNGRYFRELRQDLLDSNSLIGDWVMSIAEDANGFIWVGTDKGICKIHPGHLWCKRYLPGKKMASAINSSYVSLVADKEGTIWASTSNAILCLQKDSFIQTDFTDSKSRITYSDSGELMIAMFNSIWIKSTKTGDLKKYPNNDVNKIDYTYAYKDRKGNHWLGTWGDGLIFYDKDWKNKQQFKWDLNPVNPSTTNIIMGIGGDDHFVYVATFIGVWVYDIQLAIELSKPIDRIQYSLDQKHGLSSNVISQVYIDGEKNIWLATNSGLNVSLVLNREYKQLVEGTGFTTDILWSKGKLISASWYGKGVYFFDSTFSITHTTSHLPEYIGELDNSQISGLDMDQNGYLWVATFNGLVRYSMEDKKSTDYFTKQSNGFITNNLNDVWVNNADGEVWTANYDKGISRMKIETGEVVNINTKTGTLITNDLVWGFYDDKRGTLWILTNGGICNYDYNSGIWHQWKEVYFNGSKIPIGRCNAGYVDSRGAFWLGTENGLFIYCNQHWYFKGLEGGLPERGVNGIAEDDKGNIWLSFNHSLVNFEVKTFSSFSLSANNDILLPPIQFIFTSSDKSRLFIVSENEMYEVNTNNILSTHTASPKIYLEGFLINGKSYYSVTDKFDLEKTIFSYDDNNVEISFTSSCIGEIGNLLYSYRIGKTGSWSDPSENNRIVLPKLQPGPYQIEIRASTDGSHWTNEPLRVSFIIKPPFWATWWFRSILGILLMLLMIWWVRYLSTRKMRRKIIQLEKERAIDKERSRLSRDMHDDLGSGLTKISILSEVVKKKVKENDKVDTYLENISDSSRELVQNLNNIIWSLNPGNDTMQALLGYIREYSAGFLESCGVEFEMEVIQLMKDKEVSEQVKRNIFLIVKEALNNAVKHGKANSIIIDTEIKNDAELTISISDNGNGMDTNLLSNGNGLRNMEKRMREIGGTFLVESQKGKGTLIKLTYSF